MTFSIVAADRATSSWGVAVASKFLAAGAIVPDAAVGAGAIATQAWANLSYRASGLSLLRDGKDAAAALDLLTSGDADRAKRQVGIVDRNGESAAFTGEECPPWAGSRNGPGYAVQGNILAGPEVVAAMEESWLSTRGPISRRLLAALAAGDAAGGDRRGRQSAGLYVVSPGAGYGGGNDVLADLRVDDDPDPVARLTHLMDLHDLYFGTSEEATLLPLDGRLAEEVKNSLASLGFTGDTALDVWAGMENLEERLAPSMIDPLVLAHLRHMRGGLPG